MLWNYVKLKMSEHLTSVMEEGDLKLSYGEVILRAEKFANKLTGSCYAVLCNNEMNAAVALLACLAAGKTAIPLSQRYGEAHVEKILTRTKPEYMITDDFGELDIVKLSASVQFEQTPALIMCTSGTSGMPKGVMLSEVNIRTNLDDIRSYFELSENDRILIARPLYHSAVLTGEFLTALTFGVHIFFSSHGINPEHLIEQLIDKQITVFCGTPTLLAFIARLLKGRGKQLALRKIGISGECMTEYAADTIRKGFTGTDIYHLYGLTEASPRVAYLPPLLYELHSGSVGFLLPSIDGKIVNEAGEKLSEHEVGELLIRGPSIMMGYYRDDEATSRTIKEGWLHTGDLAVFENGLLRIMGRKDDLIIYAGMNIYPSEVENALKADSRVHEVMAYGIPDKLCGQKIGIMISGDFTNKHEIVRLCNQLLPPYACPSTIEWVDTLPKNGSGKLVRSRIKNTQ